MLCVGFEGENVMLCVHDIATKSFDESSNLFITPTMYHVLPYIPVTLA